MRQNAQRALYYFPLGNFSNTWKCRSRSEFYYSRSKEWFIISEANFSIRSEIYLDWLANPRITLNQRSNSKMMPKPHTMTLLIRSASSLTGSASSLFRSASSLSRSASSLAGSAGSASSLSRSESLLPGSAGSASSLSRSASSLPWSAGSASYLSGSASYLPGSAQSQEGGISSPNLHQKTAANYHWNWRMMLRK